MTDEDLRAVFAYLRTVPPIANAVPQPLFRGTFATYDVSADGQRFLVPQPVEDLSAIPLTFVSGALSSAPEK